jgi:predicted transcriptional regulator
MLSLSATKELYWRKDFKMGKLEKEVLEYTKKHKGITPGEIVQFLSSVGHKLGYAHATSIIDTLYANGYVDQSAFYWEKGKIKYVGK